MWKNGKFISYIHQSKISLVNSLRRFRVQNNTNRSVNIIWTASSEFGTYRLCEQRRFRRACASAQSLQNLRCSLIQALSQEEHSDRKPDPWPLWMAGHAQLKFVMTECSKTQIRLSGLISKTRLDYGIILADQFQPIITQYYLNSIQVV